MTSPLPLQRPALVEQALTEALASEVATQVTPPAQKLGAEAIAADALAAVSAAPLPVQSVVSETPQSTAPLAPVTTPGATPVATPDVTAPAAPVSRVKVYFDADIRPIPRGARRLPQASVAPRLAEVVAGEQTARAAATPVKVALASTPPIYSVRVPLKRPRGLKGPSKPQVVPVAATKRTKPNTAPVSTGRAGKLCGDKRIRGRKMSPIKGRLAGCGIAAPVLVSEVAGIPLSRPATLDCAAARAMADWVERGVKPAIGRYGGGLSELKVVASYSCRTRNNKKGAKLSEHAKGRAVDVAAFELKKGGSLDLLSDWRTKKEGAILKKIHKAACGPFGTVLGPNADRYHQDHLHMDVAKYRSGAYCR